MENTAVHPQPGSRFGFPRLPAFARKALIIWVFAVFPIIVLQVALRLIDRLEVQKSMEGLQRRQERYLGILSGLDDDVGMVGRSITRVFGKIQSRSLKSGKKYLDRLKKLFPEEFDLYIFDPNGKIIQEYSSKRHARKMTEIVFGLLQELVSGKKLAPNLNDRIKGFFSIPIPGALKNSKGQVTLLMRREMDSNLLWTTIEPTGKKQIGGYLALIHNGKCRKNRALSAAIRRLEKKRSQCKFGTLDLTGGNFILDPPKWGEDPLFRTGLMTSLTQYQQFFEAGAVQAALILRGTTGYLLCLAPKPRFFSSWSWFVFDAFCLYWGLVLCYRVLSGQLLIQGKITAKLIILFLFAVGTPSLVLLVGGFYALKDHSHVLLQSVENKVREKLVTFDQRFPTEVSSLEGKLGKLVAESRGKPTLEERLPFFKNLGKLDCVDQVMVVDQRGKAVYCKNDVTNDPKAKFPLYVCQELLKKINKVMTIDAGTMVVETTEGFFDSLMGPGSSFSLDSMVSGLGRFNFMKVFDEASYLYIDAFFDKDGKAEHLLLAQVRESPIERFYLTKNLPDLLRQPDITWTISAKGDRHDSGEVINNAEEIEQINKIYNQVKATQTAARAVIASGSQEFLWFGLRGQNISRFTLVVKTPLSDIQRRIKILWAGLVGIALLIFLSTSVIGLMLSEQFLMPIEDLTRGIHAIKLRAFETRIPIHARDELGEMSGLMNTVLEGMGDLQVARVVQESLFPQKPVEIKGYKIFGQSRSMADIGGDYFDYFLSPDKKLWGVVGDVSGHGVSAALIMGMAKCAVNMAQDQGKGLLEVLTTFNIFLLNTIKRKKMMTLFLFRLDTETNVFSYANAGHNFPFYWKAAEELLYDLELISVPLGMRAKAGFAVKEFTLEPGDSILFYTDGLSEAPCHGRLQLGYLEAKRWFVNVVGRDPVEAVDLLFKRFDQVTAGFEPADDVSLICLKRLS